MRKIEVVDYQQSWQDDFKYLKEIYLDALTVVKANIEHVGSTSVIGLAAKPIIDIDIIVETTNDLALVINKLESIGYEHLGDLGIAGREAFKLNNSAATLDSRLLLGARHNLYAGLRSSPSIQNHLIIKNYLTSNEKARIEYSQLKKNLAQKYTSDIDKYVDGKTDFIIKILKMNGMVNKDLTDIEQMNKLN